MEQRLEDVLGRLGWPAVKAALLECYPAEASHVDRYRPVYERLLSLPAVPSDFVLRIELRDDDDEEWMEVHGEDGTLRDDGELECFALEFVPWSEWLGMAVPEELRRELADAQIVAHCLFEMTTCGFEEETIQAELEELKRRAREVEEMTPEERAEQFLPWEEVMAQLDE